jgi:hypothetical protein
MSSLLDWSTEAPAQTITILQRKAIIHFPLTGYQVGSLYIYILSLNVHVTDRSEFRWFAAFEEIVRILISLVSTQTSR